MILPWLPATQVIFGDRPQQMTQGVLFSIASHAGRFGGPNAVLSAPGVTALDRPEVAGPSAEQPHCC